MLLRPPSPRVLLVLVPPGLDRSPSYTVFQLPLPPWPVHAPFDLSLFGNPLLPPQVVPRLVLPCVFLFLPRAPRKFLRVAPNWPAFLFCAVLCFLMLFMLPPLWWMWFLRIRILVCAYYRLFFPGFFGNPEEVIGFFPTFAGAPGSGGSYIEVFPVLSHPVWAVSVPFGGGKNPPFIFSQLNLHVDSVFFFLFFLTFLLLSPVT